MVVGSALEDARHLAQRYDRVRQDAEAQVTNSVMQYDDYSLPSSTLGSIK